jgi:hypothetical protein
MPKTTRDKIKNRHDQILTHLETAMGYADELHDMYEEAHPDYAEGYANICLMLAQVHEFTETMKSFI